MTFFRWIKYSYSFEYDEDSFTLIPGEKRIKKKTLISLKTFLVEISLYSP